MKSIFNKSYLILSALFLLGVVGSVYVLFNLPTSIERISAKIDLNAIKEAGPAINVVMMVVGVTLFTGTIALLVMYLRISRVSGVEKIVYVDRKEDKVAEDVAKAQKAESDFSKEYQDIISSVKGIKDQKLRTEKLLSRICMKIDASQALYYHVKKEKGIRYIEMAASFAFSIPESETVKYEFGEGLAGQAAKDGKVINISEVPKGYITIISGLGSSSPNHLVILPLKQGEEVTAVVEVASFKPILPEDIHLISEVLKPEDEGTKAPKKGVQADQSIQPQDKNEK